MSKNHEGSRGSNVTTGLVLLESAGNRDVKQNRPWNTNFCPHLEVNYANAGVQGSSHEKIIKQVARHTVVGTLDMGGDENKSGQGEPPHDSNGHDVAKVINDVGKSENTSDVKESGEGQSAVPSCETIAEVRQLKEKWVKQTAQMTIDALCHIVPT
jgi:hypothetical protein